MVLGHDVGLGDIVGLYFLSMEGKFSYMAMNNKHIVGWAAKNWAPLVVYNPDISILPKGWYGFLFHTKSHASLILNETLLKVHGSLVIKN